MSKIKMAFWKSDSCTAQFFLLLLLTAPVATATSSEPLTGTSPSSERPTTAAAAATTAPQPTSTPKPTVYHPPTSLAVNNRPPTTATPSISNALANMLMPLLASMLQGGSGNDVTDLDVDRQCAEDLAVFNAGLSEGQEWAMKMLDAMGKLPAGLFTGENMMVGDYDTCLSLSHQNGTHTITGQYCIAAIKIPISLLGTGGNSDFNFHVCVPRSCNNSDVLTVLHNTLSSFGGEASTVTCNQEKHPTEDNAFIVALVLFGILGLLCVAGTVYDVWLDATTITSKGTNTGSKPITSNNHLHSNLCGETVPTAQSEESQDSTPSSLSKETNGGFDNLGFTNDKAGLNGALTHVTIDVANGKDGHKPKKRASKSQQPGMTSKLLLSFSVLRNGRKILDCGPVSSDVACLHGIRVLSITWVILGHSFSNAGVALGNTLGPPTLLSYFPYTGILGSLFAVDTFFMLGGCLTAFLFLRTTAKSGLHVSTMVLYYAHRLWRLTPLYALVLMFWIGFYPYMKVGPFADQVTENDERVCRKYWHYNLLYINNLFDNYKMCFGWSWYLSNDMQFHVIAPIVLIPWVFSRRIKIVGFIMAACLILTHVITTAVLSYTEESSFLVNADFYMPHIYFAPWCRVGPYAVGLILGYILHKTHFQYTMEKLTVGLGWLLAWSVGLTVTYVQFDKFGDMLDQGLQWAGSWSAAGAAVYEAVSRVLWALSVSWVIFACSNGYGGFVNTLLSWKAWIPLSRLSYGAYLIHLVIMNLITGNVKRAIYYDGWYGTQMFCASTLLSFLAAFVFAMLIESPCVGLEKAVLGKIFKRP